MVKLLKLFAQCIPVKGKKRSIIYDLQRNDYEFIPNDTYDLLRTCEGKTIDEINQIYSGNEDQIKEYIDFLLEKEYIFWCEDSDYNFFPPLNTEWDYPAHISNAVIEINQLDHFNVKEVISQLEKLGCQFILFKNKGSFNTDFYNHLLSEITESSVRSIQIIADYSHEILASEIKKFVKLNKRVQNIYFYKSEKDKFYRINDSRIFFIKRKLEKNISNVNPLNFVVNLPLFMEMQFHNAYFNRKVSIDSKGNIKNSLHTENSYGNIFEHNISDVVKLTEFKEYCNVTKDKIKKCQDCEFRFMCVDNSILIFNKKENIWERATECNYNPNLAKWS